MARTSRRTTISQRQERLPSTDIYPTAIYARLSVENSGKDDHGSAIQNQIEVCREYISECTDLQLVKIYEDNGWTGTTMHRPAFDEMMEAVKNGSIRAIVVRDLSRFARNYIEIGTYLEKVLPQYEVRFISVKEQFDTFTTDKSNESLMVPLQNLINDLYSKDISRKVEAALHTQMENRTFRWRRIPYGYRWNADHTNIVPDEAQAPFVRDIFRWKEEGVPNAKIAERLDEAQAPKYNGDTDRPWAVGTIGDILTNPAYIGSRVYGRRHSAIYKGIRLEKKPKEEWYVIPNAHEAIIEKELFEKINQRMRENYEKRQAKLREYQAKREKIINYFDKKIICADCGYKMYFHRHRMDCKDKHYAGSYYCSSHQIRKQLGCSIHYISQDVLNQKVMDAIRLQIRIALDYEELIHRLLHSSSEHKVRERLEKSKKSVLLRLHAVQTKRKRLYEDYTDGILNESEYLYAKEAYEKEYELLTEQYELLAEKIRAYQEAISPQNKWIQMLKSVKRKKKLTQELVDSLVEKVRVFEHGDIELTLRYQDVFELTRDYLGQIQAGGDTESLESGDAAESVESKDDAESMESQDEAKSVKSGEMQSLEN